jgi:hypothetical protein
MSLPLPKLLFSYRYLQSAIVAYACFAAPAPIKWVSGQTLLKGIKMFWSALAHHRIADSGSAVHLCIATLLLTPILWGLSAFFQDVAGGSALPDDPRQSHLARLMTLHQQYALTLAHLAGHNLFICYDGHLMSDPDKRYAIKMHKMKRHYATSAGISDTGCSRSETEVTAEVSLLEKLWYGLLSGSHQGSVATASSAAALTVCT